MIIVPLYVYYATGRALLNLNLQTLNPGRLLHGRHDPVKGAPGGGVKRRRVLGAHTQEHVPGHINLKLDATAVTGIRRRVWDSVLATQCREGVPVTTATTGHRLHGFKVARQLPHHRKTVSVSPVAGGGSSPGSGWVEHTNRSPLRRHAAKKAARATKVAVKGSMAGGSWGVCASDLGPHDLCDLTLDCEHWIVTIVL